MILPTNYFMMIRKKIDEVTIFILWTTIALFSWSLSAAVIQDHGGTQPSLPSVIVEPSTRENKTWFGVRKETSHLYVDKTEYLERLLNQENCGKYFFLTRPPGFGKSVFLDMIEHFFRGHKHLFEGSHIYERGNAAFFYERMLNLSGRYDSKGRKWVEYPVIRLNFGENTFADINTEEDFEKIYYQMLGNLAISYSLNNRYDFDFGLSCLLSDLEQKFNLPVVILVDEFDGLMEYVVDVKKNNELAKRLIVRLENVLRCIKEEHRNFLTLITAVSRYEHVNEYGEEVNVYAHITYHENYATMFGFTAEEIEANFKPYFMDRFNPQADNRRDKSVNKTIKSFIRELKEQCGSYNFAYKFGKSESMVQKTLVMNPLSVIECLMRRKFTNRNYLTRNSLDKIVRRFYSEQRFPDEFENGIDIQRSRFLSRRKYVYRSFVEPKHVIHSSEKGGEYIIDDIPLVLEMLLYGYLTIKAFSSPTNHFIVNLWNFEGVVTLKYPNKEIEEVLKTRYASYIPSKDDFITNLVNWTDSLSSNLKSGDIRATMNTLEKYEYPRIIRKQAIKSWDVTRRIFTFLRSTPDIDCDQSLTFKMPNSKNETGVIDLVTRNLSVNLVIKVKKDGSALEGIEELFKYLIHYPKSFRKAIRHPRKAYFVSIYFKWGKLEWIAVPYTNGNLRFREAEATSPYVLEDVKYLEMKRGRNEDE